MTTTSTSLRTVSGVADTVRQLEGAGFEVRRPFPTRALDHFDPFMLLDHMGPTELAPGEAQGAPDHPHRGFETVTYLLEGGMVHKDSAGNSGRLGPGDVQWMTAGAGVVHSELPSAELLRNGGRMHGFQLWVNLPRRDKLIHPRYQGVPAAQLPTATSEDGKVWVRVIAGEALGVHAVIETRTPISYLHFQLRPGASVTQPVPREYNAFAYVVDGEGVFGAERTPAAEGQAVFFSGDGDQVALAVPEAATQPMNVLLIAGVPLNEPVFRYGPFVMNTREEIIQAVDDYQHGRMGRIS